MRRMFSVIAFFSALVLSTGAFANPVWDFETAFRRVYIDYREALYLTNTRNAEASVKALTEFETKWQALLRQYRGSPPPHFASDAAFTQSLDRVSEAIAAAREKIASKELEKAHERLETIRDIIGAMRERNGIIGFSDRMNAYHAKMEEMLSKDYSGFDASGLGSFREDAAVLAYLAEMIMRHPPREAADPSFMPLLMVFKASSDAVLVAARSNDAKAAKAALNGLKGAYARLFLAFG
jgi:hypothetical protein